MFQSGRDSHGAGIALFTAKYHNPTETTHQVVLKALVYLLDAALERYIFTNFKLSSKMIIDKTTRSCMYFLFLYICKYVLK